MTATHTLGAPATPAQISFIRDLIAKHEVTPAMIELVESHISAGTLYKADASVVIDQFKRMPRRAAAAPRAGAPRANVLVELNVPKSRYAIPATSLIGENLDVNVSGEYLFIEVKEYKGTVYMRRLLGAPGSYTRVRLTSRDVEKIAKIVASDAYAYTRLFGDLYSCCGKCGAELTDDESRRLMLGPVCRQAFGF